MKKSKIILLNGCSSAGKSSLVKAIQHLSEESWLTTGVDVSFAVMSAKYLPGGKKAHEGINFVSGTDEKGFPVVKVERGDYGKKVRQSIRKVVKQLADEGLNLILDEVIWEKQDLENYTSLLKDHQVYYVKVNCELPIMEEREILRRDRALGLARGQFAKIGKLNKIWKYDLVIDTSQTSPFANAKKILEFIKKPNLANFV